MSTRMTPEDRRVITFYSYKGGVGRTMALANCAYRLANTHGLKVIAVDWDLEAPGLHRYFGITDEVAAKTNGVLDYFLAWGAAVKRGDPEPPSEEREVMGWILPVEDKDHKPKYGELSVLLAGRQDRGYDQRLSRFDWREFYADEGGAAAVEALRKKLVDRADVVLVDSRTGLTDAGGVCAIQIPDGVVLLTAPNEQSLEGTREIARRISRASAEERAGRPRAKVWLSVSRTPSNEESYLAEDWFEKHALWFEKGIEQGLWLKEDHTDGIRTLEIPHVGRWGFGENLLVLGPETETRDPLERAYVRLTETLLRWVRGEPPIPVIEPRSPTEASEPKDVAALEREAREAEERGDVLGLGITLLESGSHPRKIRKKIGRNPEARAGAWYLPVARGPRTAHARTCKTWSNADAREPLEREQGGVREGSRNGSKPWEQGNSGLCARQHGGQCSRAAGLRNGSSSVR